MGNMTNRVSELKRPNDEFPRRFVPEKIDLSKWDSIEPLFNKLLNTKADSAGDIEKWLINQSELFAALDEEGARLYIAMTCATDDETAKKNYLYFIENIEPKIKTMANELDKKFLNNSNLNKLEKNRYEVLIRAIKNRVEIFKKENVPLETEVAKLSQEYQSISGAMSVNFQGEEKTMQQMNVYLEETDRETRKESWELTAKRRLKDRTKLDELFNKMLALRTKIAKNAGFKNYIEYRFRELERFDYKPEDCTKFQNAVEKVVMPAYNKSLQSRKENMKFKTLRPWDLSVDVYNRPSLKPFKKADELSNGCYKIFNKVEPILANDFKKMIDGGLLDLDSRKGKAPGGYQIGLQEVRLPFIFMNAVGLNRDVFTLLHEGGHAFHQFAVHEEPLVQYRHAPMEYCEVASMSMELIGANYLEEFYNKAEVARARKKHLEGILSIFPWIATIDAFQHWIYSNPNHTTQERNKYWTHLMNRFGGEIDFSGYEDILESIWHRQLHVFEVPFYYIEYGIAQLGALQIWHNSKSNLKNAISDYRNGLALGGSRPLPELFKKSSIKFDFTERTLKPLIDDVIKEIELLAQIEKNN